MATPIAKDGLIGPAQPANELPLVSIVLLTFNCERFVAAAVASALGQDYPGPLEFIFSDDASTDRTFDLLRDLARQYRGAHRIVVGRRSSNTGSKSAHLNAVLADCSGEILVSFDGDDVARPSRVSRIVERFLANRQVQAVYSSYSLIGEGDEPRGTVSVPHPPDHADAATWFARVDAYASGATLAICRSLVETFGELDPGVNEDIVLPFRASLIGRVEYIDTPLVNVRRHRGSLTADWARFDSIERYRERMESGIQKAGRAMRCRLADLDLAARLMPEHCARWTRLRRLVGKSLREAEMTRSLTDDSLFVRVRTLLGLLCIGAYLQQLPQHASLALAPRLYLRYKRRRLRGSSDGCRARQGDEAGR